MITSNDIKVGRLLCRVSGILTYNDVGYILKITPAKTSLESTMMSVKWFGEGRSTIETFRVHDLPSWLKLNYIIR